ncbi:MAG TPA: hypothetical protein ENI23_06425 [bacterium]|nr:hypothetical protein [bacterium]
MQENIYRKLVTINLRYGTTAKSLKVLAFANLSAKALFLSGNFKTIQEIAKEVARLIGVRAVSGDLIKSGLEELKDDKKVNLQNNKWRLGKKTREEMTWEISSSDKKLGSVINRHFPRNIESNKLKLWFNDALVDFFNYNGDEWVQSVCKGSQTFPKKIKTLDELLNKSIKAHSLEKNSCELNNSFRGFLASTHKDDQIFLTNIGFAMFSARLVAADIGADPIALEELKNTTFLVDTNFLFALHLDSHRFASSLEALGQALRVIGAKMQYIYETKEEYGRLLAGKRAETLKLLEVYPSESVTGADDDFMSTALARGCKKVEDFERFFTSIAQLPKEISRGPKLTLLDNEQILEETDKARKDTALKDSIQKWRLRFQPSWNQNPKKESALEHDAALIYVAEFEKKPGNKVLILTLDRSLQACSAERVGKHEIPRVICLEGLIQILAVNNAGPGFDATNFAPLMSNILLKRCVPPDTTYSTQDLYWLYGIQKNVAQFNPDKIRTIVLEVTRARLSGKNADDKKLQRTVNRLYQEEIQSTDQEVKTSLDRARRAEEEAQSEKSKRLELESKLQEVERKEIIRKARIELVTTLIWRIPAALILAYVAYYLASLALPTLQKNNLLGFFITILTFLGIGYKFLKNPMERFSNIKKTNQSTNRGSA